MKETILYYHITDEMKAYLMQLQDQLHIHLQEITDQDIHQKMGYILHIPEYEKQEKQFLPKPKSSLLYFAHMSDKQLDILLQLLRQSGLPSIPFKAMMTPHNLDFTFYELYHEIEEEYLMMSKR